MIFSIALKNIFRNKKRTILSGSTLFLVALLICFMMSIEYGSLEDMTRNVIFHETGNVRVRNPLYTKNERITPLGLYIENTQDVIKNIKTIEGVKSVEPKIKTNVMIYQNEDTTSASLIGIDFNSKTFFLSDDVVVEGSLDFDNQTGKRKNVIVTDIFAKTFNLHCDDKFTFITKTASGGTNAITANVKAIIHFADADYSSDTFFIDYKEIAKVLRMNDNVTELLVISENEMDTALSKTIKGKILNMYPELEGLLWTEVSGYYALFESADIMYFCFALIFFILAATVIFNSTMMSVMERKKEIGTLLSLGMEAKTVQYIFLLETIIISALSTLLGCLCGAVFIEIFNNIGLDMSKLGYDTMEGINYTTMLYPTLSFGRYVEFFLTGFLTSVVACVLPSRMALKVHPAEALRTEN